MRKRWVQVEGELIPAEDYTPEPIAPMVMPDIQPYKSQVTGEMINSRSAHRAHLKAHRMIEVGNETKYLQPRKWELPKGRKETIIRLVNEKLR